jgi:hypothetical protein
VRELIDRGHVPRLLDCERDELFVGCERRQALGAAVIGEHRGCGRHVHMRARPREVFIERRGLFDLERRAAGGERKRRKQTENR